MTLPRWRRAPSPLHTECTVPTPPLGDTSAMDVPRTVLGRTGLEVSVLGTGGAYSKCDNSCYRTRPLTPPPPDSPDPRPPFQVRRVVQDGAGLRDQLHGHGEGLRRRQGWRRRDGARRDHRGRGDQGARAQLHRHLHQDGVARRGRGAGGPRDLAEQPRHGLCRHHPPPRHVYPRGARDRANSSHLSFHPLAAGS